MCWWIIFGLFCCVQMFLAISIFWFNLYVITSVLVFIPLLLVVLLLVVSFFLSHQYLFSSSFPALVLVAIFALSSYLSLMMNWFLPHQFPWNNINSFLFAPNVCCFHYFGLVYLWDYIHIHLQCIHWFLIMQSYYVGHMHICFLEAIYSCWFWNHTCVSLNHICSVCRWHHLCANQIKMLIHSVVLPSFWLFVYCCTWFHYCMVFG